LKTAKEEISSSLSTIINRSIDEGVFPSVLKQSRITPVFKKGCKSDPSNYRPVSVINALAVCVERVMNVQLTTFLEASKKLDDNQYGFRPGRSCGQAVAHILNNITRSLDSRNYTMMIAVDCSKAFDTVSHSSILQGLAGAGVGSRSRSLLMSYLTDRCGFVQVGGEKSSLITPLRGVPQGSVLGPTLFSVAADLRLSGLSGEIYCQYADDITLIISCKTLDGLSLLAAEAIDTVESFLSGRGLSVNISKTQIMVVDSRTRLANIPEDFSINIRSGQTLHRCSEIKILGVTFDETLSFSSHFSQVMSGSAKIVKLLTRTASHLHRSIRHDLATALVYPKWTYCDWALAGFLCSTAAGDLQKQQRRCGRWVAWGKAGLKPVSTGSRKLREINLCTELGWYDIIEKIKSHVISRVWRSVNDTNCPSALRFETLKTSTRLAKTHGVVIESRPTVKRLKTFNCFGAKLWNSQQSCRESKSAVDARSRYLCSLKLS
jgi:hypothetical protein